MCLRQIVDVDNGDVRAVARGIVVAENHDLFADARAVWHERDQVRL
jgi:hypothetical protein